MSDERQCCPKCGSAGVRETTVEPGEARDADDQDGWMYRCGRWWWDCDAAPTGGPGKSEACAEIAAMRPVYEAAMKPGATHYDPFSQEAHDLREAVEAASDAM